MRHGQRDWKVLVLMGLCLLPSIAIGAEPDAPAADAAPEPARFSPATAKPVPVADEQAEATDPPATAADSGEATAPPAVTARSQQSAPAGWIDLLEGDNLDQWVVQDGKAECWNVADGQLVCNAPGGGWLRTVREFEDFDLRLEFRLAPGANSGIGFRFPHEGSPSSTGFEVQLVDEAAPKYADLRPDQRTGSLYYHIAPQHSASLLANEWHAAHIVACGSHIVVEIDGQLVNEVWLEKLESPEGAATAEEADHPLLRKPFGGFVGLQSSNQRIEFRNVQVRNLLRSSPTGLQAVDIRAGAGATCPPGANVTVDYVGRLADGTKFDSSYDRGEAATFGLDQVIRGWELGIPGMKVGGMRRLVIPAALGYGDSGVPPAIPGGATLIFEVELHGFEH
ncbi:MAG: family 16 glycoside hydrolase [Planctomycetaceae bacterium]